MSTISLTPPCSLLICDNNWIWAGSSTCRSLSSALNMAGTPFFCSIKIIIKEKILQPEKTADISRCHHSCFPAKWRPRNERRNSILMTRHYSDLGSASDWLKQIPHLARPIRGTTKIWVVTGNQWKFCPRFANVISWGNRGWCREMSVVF